VGDAQHVIRDNRNDILVCPLIHSRRTNYPQLRDQNGNYPQLRDQNGNYPQLRDQNGKSAYRTRHRTADVSSRRCRTCTSASPRRWASSPTPPPPTPRPSSVSPSRYTPPPPASHLPNPTREREREGGRERDLSNPWRATLNATTDVSRAAARTRASLAASLTCRLMSPARLARERDTALPPPPFHPPTQPHTLIHTIPRPVLSDAARVSLARRRWLPSACSSRRPAARRRTASRAAACSTSRSPRCRLALSSALPLPLPLPLRFLPLPLSSILGIA
jgi:hypothetical protein